MGDEGMDLDALINDAEAEKEEKKTTRRVVVKRNPPRGGSERGGGGNDLRSRLRGSDDRHGGGVDESPAPPERAGRVRARARACVCSAERGLPVPVAPRVESPLWIKSVGVVVGS